MYVRPILWIFLFISVQEVSLQEDEDDYYDEAYEDPQPLNCSTTESIRGGHVTYSQEGLEGSELTYHCGLGKYPFPVGHRLCGPDGEWSRMRLPNGRQVSQATCKELLCPAQLQLDNGHFWPMDQWFRIGATQSFFCDEGYTLSGSAQRNCTLSGEWTGTTPVCDNHAEDCHDPGIPPGAQRSGRPRRGEKVIYQCQAGLDLLGSAERTCLENKEWTGSTPRCQGLYTFDSPSKVAAAMGGSLAGVMDVFSSDKERKDTSVNFGRTFRVEEGSRMNVYILLDTSGSITKKAFEESRKATLALIDKLDSYEVKIKFHVLSFASKAIDIVDIRDPSSGDTEEVKWMLEIFDYHRHGNKTGTNLYAALHRVNEMISFLKQNSAKNHFNETQNIIVIETDGYSNTGIKPQNALAQIRGLLGYNSASTDHTDETMLDVYVFGIGERVNKDQLNSLASKKRDEQHVFILQDYETLAKVFNSIISDKSVTMCGIAQEIISNKQEDNIGIYTKPWHVKVTPYKSTTANTACFGSIVSQDWVLTAAHCFARASTDPITQPVSIAHGEGLATPKRVIMHPKYNINKLRDRNVSEFYDYDVALVQLNKSIPLSWKARPICLPCTVPASRAMKNISSTCQQHREELLPHMETAAFFIHDKTKLEHKETHIHTGDQRPACVEKARRTLKEPTDVALEEYVPDRFLCTGGSSTRQSAIACKGDSGGSLFLQKKKRYFQVGVLSWGTIDACSSVNSVGRKYNRNQPHPDARDFHIDLFKIMPWLKQHLGEDIQFLPDIN